MKRAAVGLGAFAGLCSVAALAAAAPRSAPAVGAPSAGSSITTTSVGPNAASSAGSAATPVPASAGASASQWVTGRVASTTGIALTGTRPSYRGTEPATMTVSHSGSQVTVTVTPR